MSGARRGRSLIRALPAATLLAIASAAAAQAQDRSVVGDWRHIGQTDDHGYGWNASDVRRDGSRATVSILRTPLAGGSNHEILTFVIDCEAGTYRITGLLNYGEDDSIPPSERMDDGPHPLAGPAAAVQGPVCSGVPELTPGRPVSAKVFSTGLREYISSGAMAWAEANPRR